MTMSGEQLREEFEEWHTEKHWTPIFDEELGRFIPTVVQNRWEAYQAGRAALQSPEIEALKKDAERYRFIQAKVYASNAYGRASWKFHYDNLPLPLDNPTRGLVKQHFEDAIDFAIRLEEDGNKC